MKFLSSLYFVPAIVALSLAVSPLAGAEQQAPVSERTLQIAQAQEKETARRPDVPYVPTTPEVVSQMLKLAAVKKDDVLYDLGCGDGRIVITAVQKYGASGVGIDIDPQRIKEANENARQAGVTDKVKFIQGDLFDADLSKATVVTLYLLPDVNMRLRPKLLSELKPGTRVVSHNYHMGDWQPQEQLTLGNHTVYLWTVPEKAAAR